MSTNNPPPCASDKPKYQAQHGHLPGDQLIDAPEPLATTVDESPAPPSSNKSKHTRNPSVKASMPKLAEETDASKKDEPLLHYSCNECPFGTWVTTSSIGGSGKLAKSPSGYDMTAKQVIGGFSVTCFAIVFSDALNVSSSLCQLLDQCSQPFLMTSWACARHFLATPGTWRDPFGQEFE